MDCIVHGVAKSQTRLSDFDFQLIYYVLSVKKKVGFDRGGNLGPINKWLQHGGTRSPAFLLPPPQSWLEETQEAGLVDGPRGFAHFQSDKQNCGTRDSWRAQSMGSQRVGHY